MENSFIQYIALPRLIYKGTTSYMHGLVCGHICYLNDIIATFPETLCPLSLCGAGKIAGADNPCP